eukprot:4947815-Prymnesium_polylepis.1
MTASRACPQTFFYMGGDLSRVLVLPIGNTTVGDPESASKKVKTLQDRRGEIEDEDEDDVLNGFTTFDARTAKCALESDRQRLLGMIESGLGSIDAFNELVRKIFRFAGGGSENKRKRSFTVRVSRRPSMGNRRPSQAAHCCNRGSSHGSSLRGSSMRQASSPRGSKLGRLSKFGGVSGRIVIYEDTGMGRRRKSSFYDFRKIRSKQLARHGSMRRLWDARGKSQGIGLIPTAQPEPRTSHNNAPLSGVPASCTKQSSQSGWNRDSGRLSVGAMLSRAPSDIALKATEAIGKLFGGSGGGSSSSAQSGVKKQRPSVRFKQQNSSKSL